MDGSSLTAWILLAAALLLIVACGVFVAAEFAFVTVDRSRVEQAATRATRAPRCPAGAPQPVHPAVGGPGRDHGHQPAIGFLAEPAIAALIDDPLAALGIPRERSPWSPSASGSPSARS